MKYCENCGMQLEDNAVFCEECGTKQGESQGSINVVANEEKEPVAIAMPQGEVAKKQKNWLVILMLILCSPLVAMFLLMWLPEFLFWIIYIAVQLFALVYMWKMKAWKTWMKIAITAAYLLCYIL